MVSDVISLIIKKIRDKKALRGSVIYLGSQPVGGRASLWAFRPVLYTCATEFR